MRNMKDSGIEWIGYIPEDWQVRKLPSFCEINIGLTHTPKYIDDGIPFLSVKDISGNKIDLSNTKYVSKEEYEKMPIGAKPRKGDLLFGRVCTLGVPKVIDFDDEICIFVSLGYLRFKNENIAMKKYIVHWMNSELFNQEVQRFINGSTQQNLNTRWMNNFYVLLPPVIEQGLIADYLDDKVKEIDNIISKTQETIEEYKKYKQSVITEAVTKGLNANVEMKDSGIEWIGEIPRDWNITPLKYLVGLNEESLKENTDDEYQFDYIDIGSVTLEDGIKEYHRMKFSDSPSRARRKVKYKDVIVSTVRTYLKAIATIPDKEDIIVSTGFAVLTPYNINHKYLSYFTKSNYFTDIVSAYSTGISYPAINSSEIINFKIVFGDENEQKKIANYLDIRCTEIDNLITKKQELITQLETYKKSLIYECVTGKKEVALAYAY